MKIPSFHAPRGPIADAARWTLLLSTPPRYRYRLRAAWLGLSLLVLALVSVQPAHAAQGPTATLHAAFLPERLGAGTTIKFALTITPANGAFPPALVAIDLRYPADLGIGTSDLGPSSCLAGALEADGPPGCPTNSVMGYGTALVEVPFGAETLQERARATTFMAPLWHEHFQLLFYVDGERPVSTQIVLPAAILPASPPYGGDLSTTLPLIPSVPEAPDVALTTLTMTLGPSHVTYYEYAKHKKIPYHPHGIVLPPTCPRHGFQFAADLAFADGTTSNVATTVPCPRNP